MEDPNTKTFVVPKLTWLSPRRRGPTCYCLVSLNVETFIVGGMIGVYIAWRKRFYTPREDPEENQRLRSTLIEFESIEEEIETKDRIKKLMWNVFLRAEAFTKLTPFFLRTGLLHCCTCCVYRIVTLSEGKLVPTAFTYLIATDGDEDFQVGWSTLGRVTFFACVVDCIRLFIFSRSFRAPIAHPILKNIIEPILSILYPPQWMYSRMTMGCQT